MEGILFHGIATGAKVSTSDAEFNHVTSPSSQDDGTVIPLEPIEEYVPLFGVKKLPSAETLYKRTDPHPSIDVQNILTVLSPLPNEATGIAQSLPLVLQDTKANVRSISNGCIEGSIKVPEEINIESARLSPSFEDDGSISAESVEETDADGTNDSLNVTDFIRIMQQGNRKQYDLREINRNDFRGSGWKDTDMSGDYDPSIESKKALPSRKIKPQKSAKYEAGEDELVPKRRQYRASNHEQGQKTGQSTTLNLGLSSENGHGLAEECSLSGDPEIDTSEREHSVNNTSHGGSAGGKINGKHKTCSCGPGGNEDQLPGHLEAPGCKACCEVETNSSLVAAYKKRKNANTERISGPAKLFQIDDILSSTGGEKSQILPAAQIKSALTDSKSKNQTPTFVANVNTNRDGSLATSAIPQPRTRVTPKKREPKQRLPSNGQVPKKRAQRAVRIGNSKTRLSRRLGAAKPKSVAIRSKRRNTKLKTAVSSKFSKPSHAQKVEGGRFLYITTSYCHPISFNWIPPPTITPAHSSGSPSSGEHHIVSDLQLPSYPCHFCTKPGLTYALAGLGQRLIEVIQWDYDLSLGYEELNGGWSEEGEERTRMCMSCTMERMIICLCEGHIIRSIAGLDPKKFDHDAAMRGVVQKMMGLEFVDSTNEEEESEREDEVKWCSVCIFPAFYECCNRPMITVSGLPTLPTDDFGCGLLLCEVCASRLMGTSCPSYRRPPRLNLDVSSTGNGNSGTNTDRDRNKLLSRTGIKAEISLDAHIATAEKDYFNYPDGLRADASFLSTTGELMSRLGRVPTISNSIAQVISDDEEDEQNVNESHDSGNPTNATNGKHRKTPLYENRGRIGRAFKKYDKHDDFKSTEYINSEDDSVSAGETISSPHAKNEGAILGPKANMRANPKSGPKPRGDSWAEPPDGRARTNGGNLDRGIKAGMWGMQGFIDLS